MRKIEKFGDFEEFIISNNKDKWIVRATGSRRELYILSYPLMHPDEIGEFFYGGPVFPTGVLSPFPPISLGLLVYFGNAVNAVVRDSTRRNVSMQYYILKGQGSLDRRLKSKCSHLAKELVHFAIFIHRWLILSGDNTCFVTGLLNACGVFLLNMQNLCFTDITVSEIRKRFVILG